KHLLGLINDILDLSKIEAGKIEIHPAEFKVKELIEMVEKMVSPMIEEKGLAFEVAISEDVPLTIYNDKKRIKQVLINLLSNAIKFTESGKITVNVEYSIADFGMQNAKPEEKYTTDQSTIQFSVADTGIGIKPEHLSEVFDEFKQIEGPLKEKPTGTGLGLAISKKMVEMMGGRIRVESEYGKGSCFQFAIPVKEIIMAKRPPAILPEALDLSKKLVLTIDDEVEAQEILKVYLKTEGYEVIQAYNAMETMELARKYHPFAITLDIIMPGKDGWDILHELKKDSQTKDIPVICISILDNREMGLFLGAFEYLVKPITKEQLMKELHRLEKRFRIYDILIVDDKPQAVEFLAQYLSGETNNYRVAKAYGGKEGLGSVKEKRPDLIILDLMMPEVDGFEVIRHLKKSDETKDIPIIIVSAKKLTQEEVGYLNRNIEKIIRKGDFGKQELFKDIKKALEGI
ncbi:MAG: response regulator, partial [Deltaproteobacteria bacterium]|nr:response regulator [Deltaproteobacteria bacterium]